MRRFACGFGRQRGQRHDAAFASVVGPEDQHYVFQRNYQHQAPEDDRYRTDKVGRVQRHTSRWAEDLFHGVKRAGANIAIHDTQRTQGECGKAFFAGGFDHVRLFGVKKPEL